MHPTVIILTFNSSESISNTLASIGKLSDDVHVVDSGSTDTTVEIATAFGATVHHHPFRNYGTSVTGLSITSPPSIHGSSISTPMND
jgi:glycosyltransferase involved in cell wall biosynthesis